MTTERADMHGRDGLGRAEQRVARRPGELRTVGPPDRRLLRIYLGDHLAGADAATARARWMAQRYERAPFGAGLAKLAETIDADRIRLREMARTADVFPSIAPRWLARVGERLGRLKPNGRLGQPSPLTPLVELEALFVGINGKRALWATLRVWSQPLGLDPAELAELERDAQRQAAAVESMLQDVRSRALGPAPQK
jgi:hypothetical protein